MGVSIPKFRELQPWTRYSNVVIRGLGTAKELEMPSSLIPLNKTGYVAPKLTVYGEAKTLTASGTGSNQENGTSPNCNPPNSTKRPC